MKIFKIKILISWIQTDGSELKGTIVPAFQSYSEVFQTAEGWFSPDQVELIEEFDLQELQDDFKQLKKDFVKVTSDNSILVCESKELKEMNEILSEENEKLEKQNQELKIGSGPIKIGPAIEPTSLASLAGQQLKSISMEFK